LLNEQNIQNIINQDLYSKLRNKKITEEDMQKNNKIEMDIGGLNSKR
jgi:DNA polymerase elongation subunit (family B)